MNHPFTRVVDRALNSPTDDPSVPERIVLAAIECIEREGVERVTVRQIAAEAEVNVAAINYYFRSKERLLEEARRRTIHEGSTKALAELDAYLAESGDLRAAARRLLVEQFTGMTHYPRIIQWHLREPLMDGEYGGGLVDHWNGFLRELFERLRPLFPDAPEEEQRLAMAQMWSAMILGGMMPGFFTQLTGRDFRDPGAAEAFIDTLLDFYLPER